MHDTIAQPCARRMLWLAFALVLPLPFFALDVGFAPPVRLLFLGSLVLGFVLSAPDMLSYLLLSLFLGQGLLWLGATWWLARVAAGALGGTAGVERRRVFAVLGILLVLALLPVYHLPFSSGDMQTSWLGLLR